jgi:hypothetical protein
MMMMMMMLMVMVMLILMVHTLAARTDCIFAAFNIEVNCL